MDSHFSTNDFLYGFSLYKWMNKEGHLSRWFVSRISMAYIYLVNKFHFFYCLGAYMSMCNCLKKYLLWICSVYCSSNDSRPNSMKKKNWMCLLFFTILKVDLFGAGWNRWQKWRGSCVSVFISHDWRKAWLHNCIISCCLLWKRNQTN